MKTPVEISSIFPGLLYSEASVSNCTVPRVDQDALWYPQTIMKDESVSAFDILDESLVSCDLVLASSSFVLRRSSLLSSRPFSKTRSLFFVASFSLSKALWIVSKFLLLSSTACFSYSISALGASVWPCKEKTHSRKVRTDKNELRCKFTCSPCERYNGRFASTNK